MDGTGGDVGKGKTGSYVHINTVTNTFQTMYAIEAWLWTLLLQKHRVYLRITQNPVLGNTRCCREKRKCHQFRERAVDTPSFRAWEGTETPYRYHLYTVIWSITGNWDTFSSTLTHRHLEYYRELRHLFLNTYTPSFGTETPFPQHLHTVIWNWDTFSPTLIHRHLELRHLFLNTYTPSFGVL